MDNHGITMSGKFINQKTSTLPTWVSTDEGRLIYVEDEDKLYYGSDSMWKETKTSESDLKKGNLL